MQITNLKARLTEMLDARSRIYLNLGREELIQAAVENGEAMVSKSGALATWTKSECTGRSPQDTVIVRRKESENNIDWTSQISISEETFDMLFEDAYNLLENKKRLYITKRVIGADKSYALPVKTVTSHAITALFTRNMFRAIPKGIRESILHDKEFTLLVLPHGSLDKEKYKGRLRKNTAEQTSNMVIAMDFDRNMGVIIGSSYLGSIKKMLFTVMNYHLPFEGILPLHCSANEGPNGDSALLLGLSGTGKTTLSADPERALLGDDEHGWGDNGIANFENGCYAKMIDMTPESEPEIWNAVMEDRPYKQNGVIIENAMLYPNGEFDFFDTRKTQNSRASYPISRLTNIKKESVSTHPKTILFLTADAYGVLPPISKLDKNQAMFWFLMGYTSKLAGTETGIKEPKATFSRFFGQPFMSLNPEIYAKMLGDKMKEYNTQVFLVNTGWTGGKYGTGKRISLKNTRAMVKAAISGELNNVEYTTNEMFKLNVPKTCPGVDAEILNPIQQWNSEEDYNKTAEELISQFVEAFDNSYKGKDISSDVANQCTKFVK